MANTSASLFNEKLNKNLPDPGKRKKTNTNRKLNFFCFCFFVLKNTYFMYIYGLMMINSMLCFRGFVIVKNK